MAVFRRKNRISVRRIMSVDPRTCGPQDSASHVARIMWDNDCGCVPVVDAEGKAIGMITDRDICMAAFTRGVPLADISVASVISHHVATVHEDDTLEDAEAVMRMHRIRRVPVVDGKGRPVGLLSLNDIARHVGHRRDELDVDSFVRTFAAICGPARNSAAAE